MDKDVYFHKQVVFRGWKHELKFRTSQELFSAHDIDVGTKFLLRTIVEAGYTPQNILDPGCGYGPLGLTLKALHPKSSVHLTDRDALAVDYSRQNAALNSLDVEVYGALGYDGVTKHDYDLIASNIPGKAGEPVITYLLREAQYYLKPNGVAAIVIVGALGETAEKILAETPGAEVVLKRERSGHAVFHYRFTDTGTKPESPAFKRGVYHRKDITITFKKLTYPMHTVYGLPEFDSLSYDTRFLLKTLQGVKIKDTRRALAFNPGQGHVPAALWLYGRPTSLTVCDRDLLALFTSKHNLIENGCPLENIRIMHAAGLKIDSGEKYGLITGVLRDENKEAVQQTVQNALVLLDERGLAVLCGGSTAVTRLVGYLETRPDISVKARERWRGYSALVLEKL